MTAPYSRCTTAIVRARGLFAHYGQAFGERTKRSRFLLAEPVRFRTMDFASAKFHVEYEDGAHASWALGPIFQRPQAFDFSAEHLAVLESFESLGDDRELGLLQRRAGYEHPALLRDATVGDVMTLAEAISDGFTMFEDPDCLDILSL